MYNPSRAKVFATLSNTRVGVGYCTCTDWFFMLANQVRMPTILVSKLLIIKSCLFFVVYLNHVERNSMGILYAQHLCAWRYLSHNEAEIWVVKEKLKNWNYCYCSCIYLSDQFIYIRPTSYYLLLFFCFSRHTDWIWDLCDLKMIFQVQWVTSVL